MERRGSIFNGGWRRGRGAVRCEAVRGGSGNYPKIHKILNIGPYVSYMEDPPIKTELQMLAFVRKKMKYLVVFPDQTPHFYKSLREIATNISVDSSTISKKLDQSDSCVCTARGSDYIFWIKKLS